MYAAFTSCLSNYQMENISTEDFCKCLTPDLKLDKEKYNKLSLQIYKNLDLIESNLKLSSNLQKNLINSIFS